MTTYNIDELIEKRSAAMNSQHEAVKSYYRVRQALGYLGLFLPLALIVTGVLSDARIEPSISDFFHSAQRDIFVGSMCAIGVFLISYQGYDRQPGETFSDNWLATIAGVSAFCVALFPNESPTGQVATVTQKMVGIEFSPFVHYSAALIFFYCLGHFCFFKFAKTSDLRRRRVYIICGWVIAVCGVMIGVLSVVKKQELGLLTDIVNDYAAVFWVEAFGVWAFALSWLIKGRGDISLIATAKKTAKSVKVPSKPKLRARKGRRSGRV